MSMNSDEQEDVDRICSKRCEESRKILHLPNAGGNSVISEVMSFELMHRCFGAKLLKTEMDINYYPYGSKKTDYLIQIYGKTVAVSVTRAMKYSGIFTNLDARHLLIKKLDGINWSTRNGQEKW